MYLFNKLVLCLVRLYKLGYNASNVITITSKLVSINLLTISY